MMSDYGKILMSTANAVGASLKKKMGSLTGFAPVDWAETINKLGNKLPERTVSGAVCTFADGADDVPMPSVKASITAVQAGSGDPSPSNVRAISGFAECDVTHAKKNLFDKDSTPYVAGKYISSGSVGGTPTYQNNQNYSIFSVLINPNTTYTFGLIKANDPRWCTIDEDGNITRIATNQGGSEGTSVTFTSQANDRYLLMSVAVSGTYKCDDILQVEVGSTATDYESYAGETIPVSFGGQTIYGGELNLTTGVLTVTHGYIEFDGSENWVNVGGNYPFAFQIDTGISNKVDNPISAQGITSNLFLQATTDVPSSNAIRWQVGGSTGRIFVYDYNHSGDLTGFTQMLSTNKLQFMYKLATPTTIQLTPEEVRSFLGTNNLWANTGDSEVTYFAQPNIPTEVLHKGQISTTSDYATANFSETVADDEEIFVKVYCPARSAVDYKVIKVADIGNGLNVGFSLHTTVNCTITKTSIASQYSGDYYDIYADILAYDSAIFN